MIEISLRTQKIDKMNTKEIFDSHLVDYEQWFDKHSSVFLSEIEAVRELIPEGDTLRGIEVGLGTGRYAQALKLKEGVEPAAKMRSLALARGIDAIDAVAENLPYGDMKFDFVLMIFSIAYFNDLHLAFKEAFRVLKRNGSLLVGFIDNASKSGKIYEAGKDGSIFYSHAKFYTVNKVVEELYAVGFRHFEFRQTLFGNPSEINAVQFPKNGHGEGCFVVVKASKKNN